jgi:hypothetical protein
MGHVGKQPRGSRHQSLPCSVEGPVCRGAEQEHDPGRVLLTVLDVLIARLTNRLISYTRWFYEMKILHHFDRFYTRR